MKKDEVMAKRKRKQSSGLVTGRRAKLPQPPSKTAPMKPPKPPIQARGRTHVAGKMNGTERDYDQTVLAPRLLAGDIAWYKFEAVRLRLADDCIYVPDFMVMLADGSIEIHEVKGFWRDDARVKIRVAAEVFWMFLFVAIKRKRRRGRSYWIHEEFGPHSGHGTDEVKPLIDTDQR